MDIIVTEPDINGGTSFRKGCKHGKGFPQPWEKTAAGLSVAHFGGTAAQATDNILIRSKMKSKKTDQIGRSNAFKISILIASLALGGANPARACLYEITFDDGQNVGSGQIDVENQSGNYFACSGYLNVTLGGATGEWTLYAPANNCCYPNYGTSPGGGYWYNNEIYPNGVNPEYPGTTGILLDVYGLLFTENNGSGNEINLWGNPDGTYTLAGSINGFQNFDVQISFGNTIIAPVPEAPTTIACLLLLLPMGSVVFESRRKRKGPAPFRSLTKTAAKADAGGLPPSTPTGFRQVPHF